MMGNAASSSTSSGESSSEIVTLGAGCFWCIEAVFDRVTGVTKVESGYMGGIVDNPTYGQICTGNTGHAEAVQVTFQPAKVSLEEILEIFFKMHDPTTKNRQGADVGTQYRSVIFYSNDDQRETAVKSIEAAQPKFKNPIVTEVTSATTWYKAEKSHQDYYARNKSSNSYCRYVIHPKLQKVKHSKFKGTGLMSAMMG